MFLFKYMNHVGELYVLDIVYEHIISICIHVQLDRLMWNSTFRWEQVWCVYQQHLFFLIINFDNKVIVKNFPVLSSSVCIELLHCFLQASSFEFLTRYGFDFNKVYIYICLYEIYVTFFGIDSLCTFFIQFVYDGISFINNTQEQYLIKCLENEEYNFGFVRWFMILIDAYICRALITLTCRFRLL